MTTTPTYPRCPELAPRAGDETAQAYGLRALLFICAERITATVDAEGLEQARHAFRLAVSNRDLTSTGAEHLAEIGRSITRALGYLAAEAQAPAQPAQAPAGGAGQDRPNLGPMAPVSPRPRPQAPPSAARRQPAASGDTDGTLDWNERAAQERQPAARRQPVAVGAPAIYLAPQAAPLAVEELF